MIYGDAEFNDTLVRIIKEKYRHPYYEKACKLACEMSVHVYGDKPVELLDRVRPGEDVAIKEYRLANYEPTTKAPCGKAIKIVSKIFNPNLSSIIFPKDNQKSQKLKEYTMEYFPVYNSLTVYNKDVTLKKMIADANALMAIKPQRKPRNDAERVKPVVVIYGCENVWNWDFDHYLIFLNEERIKDEIVHTFEYYDYLQVMKFTAKVSSDNKLTTEVLLDETYTHNFVSKDGEQEIPAWKLRGNSIPLPDGQIVYESYFADAQAHWNLSIIHESDVLGAFIKHMNPQRYVIGEECHHEKEIDGFRYKCNHGIMRAVGNASAKFYTCDACEGSGKVASSPYEDHIVNKQKLDEMTNISVDSSVGYVKVPIDATKLLSERADAMVQKGSAAINMDIEDKVGENQSGIAKVYDRSAQNNTIYDIGQTMYDVHFQNQFYFINKYMFGTEDKSAERNTDDNLPQINKPTHFDVESLPELMAGLKAAKDAGLDRNVQQSKEIAYLSRDMDTNPNLKKYYISIIDLDPLYGMTQDDIDVNLMKGLIYKSDAVIHANLKPFVDRALSEDPNFLDLPKTDKLVKLKEYAEELIAAEKPKLDVNAMDDVTGSTSPGN
jgi:hypothetical protein